MNAMTADGDAATRMVAARMISGCSSFRLLSTMTWIRAATGTEADTVVEWTS